MDLIKAHKKKYPNYKCINDKLHQKKCGVRDINRLQWKRRKTTLLRRGWDVKMPQLIIVISLKIKVIQRNKEGNKVRGRMQVVKGEGR